MTSICSFPTSVCTARCSDLDFVNISRQIPGIWNFFKIPSVSAVEEFQMKRGRSISKKANKSARICTKPTRFPVCFSNEPTGFPSVFLENLLPTKIRPLLTTETILMTNESPWLRITCGSTTFAEDEELQTFGRSISSHKSGKIKR